MKCKYCNSENLVLEQQSFETNDILKANRVALRCGSCGKFIKWCAKEDRKWYLSNCDLKTDKDAKQEIIKQLKTYGQNFVVIPKISKLLFVESGSVDVDAIEGELFDMGIKIIVYRQGANKPELIDLGELK